MYTPELLLAVQLPSLHMLAWSSSMISCCYDHGVLRRPTPSRIQVPIPKKQISSLKQTYIESSRWQRDPSLSSWFNQHKSTISTGLPTLNQLIHPLNQLIDPLKPADLPSPAATNQGPPPCPDRRGLVQRGDAAIAAVGAVVPGARSSASLVNCHGGSWAWFHGWWLMVDGCWWLKVELMVGLMVN